MGAGCVPGHLIYTSAPYRGRVIDTETKAPIEGAVVLAIWYSETMMLAPESPAVDYHDALEVLTDSKGEFTVPWKINFTLFGKIRKPVFFIYYPGYAPFPSVYYTKLGGLGMVKDANGSGFTTVELPKLKTREEERLEGLPNSDPEVPREKKKNLTRLENVERVKLGMPPLHFPYMEQK